MRKEMFNHEITILRDTYRRLLRRNAKINLIKLTGKTHPADLAEVFRHFSTEEQIQIFSLMKENEHAAEFLVELDDALVIELLENESFDRIASIIEKAPTNDQSGILNVLEDEKAQSIIELLNVEEQTKIYTTQAWANFNKKNERHHSHFHSNSIVSGVLYVQTDGVKIHFERGDELWPLQLRYKKFDYLNAENWWVNSVTGKILLFPSKLNSI